MEKKHADTWGKNIQPQKWWWKESCIFISCKAAGLNHFTWRTSTGGISGSGAFKCCHIKHFSVLKQTTDWGPPSIHLKEQIHWIKKTNKQTLQCLILNMITWNIFEQCLEVNIWPNESIQKTELLSVEPTVPCWFLFSTIVPANTPEKEGGQWKRSLVDGN